MEKTIEEVVAELNSSIEEIRERPARLSSETPDFLPISIPGISGAGAINFLFSPVVENLIDKAISLLSSPKLTNFLADEKSIEKIFAKFGFGEGMFEGKISKAVIGSIEKSVNSAKFQNTTSKLKKLLIVLKNLNKKAKEFANDPVAKKKFEDSIYAIKKILVFASKVYKNRRIINDRVRDGLNNIVNESEDFYGQIERIEF